MEAVAVWRISICFEMPIWENFLHRTSRGYTVTSCLGSAGPNEIVRKTLTLLHLRLYRGTDRERMLADRLCKSASFTP
jgi:hypothetical protein